jgi:hypothetical protein
MRGSSLKLVESVAERLGPELRSEVACSGRGKGDFLMSHDLGDIIALVDGREELAAEVAAESHELREYLRKQLAAWLADESFTMLAVPGHLPFDSGRAEIVLERLRAIGG